MASRRDLWTDAYAEFLRPRTLTTGIVLVLLVMVTMIFIGPLGTRSLPPLSRALYFVVPTFVMFPLCYSMTAATVYLRRSASLLGMVPALVAGALVQSAACTAAVHAVDEILRPAHEVPPMEQVFPVIASVIFLCSFFIHYVVFQQSLDNRESTGGDRSSGRPPDDAELGVDRSAHSVTPKKTAGDASSTTGSRYDRTGQPAEHSPGNGPAVPQPSKRPAPPDLEGFYGRLPRTVSRDIIYLRMDDHYVEVHTVSGSCLILMRFGDAVAALGDLGMQTHRSFWVAKRHVLGIVRRDSATMVRVTGDHVLPISRSFLPSVRNAVEASSRKRPADERAEGTLDRGTGV